MRTIYKYKLKITDLQTIWLQEDFKILHLGVQGMPTLWYECSDDAQLAHVDIYCFGTGFCMDDKPDMEHLGTVQIGYGVWHFYYHKVEYKE